MSNSIYIKQEKSAKVSEDVKLKSGNTTEKFNFLEERAERANPDDLEKILSKVPKIKPEDFDKIR